MFIVRIILMADIYIWAMAISNGNSIYIKADDASNSALVSLHLL
jgi:hypothetical protein